MPRRAALLVIALAGAGALGGCAEPTIDAVSRLDATVDTEGPYVVEAVVVGLGGDDEVVLGYGLDLREPFTALPMVARDEAGEVVAAGIPGHAAPATIYYQVIVRDGDGDELDRAPAQPLAFDVLE